MQGVNPLDVVRFIVVKLFAEALSYLSSPNYDEKRDALARGSHMALADYVFAQAWKRCNYPKAVALARAHNLFVAPVPGRVRPC